MYRKPTLFRQEAVRGGKLDALHEELCRLYDACIDTKLLTPQQALQYRHRLDDLTRHGEGLYARACQIKQDFLGLIKATELQSRP